MKSHIIAIAAIAGSLFLAPAMIEHANAGHGGGGGHMGGHFGGGGMGHIGGALVGNIGGGNMGHFRSGHIGGTISPVWVDGMEVAGMVAPRGTVIIGTATCMVTTTTTSPITTTATLTTASSASGSAGGPATTAPMVMAPEAAVGCAAKLRSLEAPTGGTAITPA